MPCDSIGLYKLKAMELYVQKKNYFLTKAAVN